VRPATKPTNPLPLSLLPDTTPSSAHSRKRGSLSSNLLSNLMSQMGDIAEQLKISNIIELAGIQQTSALPTSDPAGSALPLSHPLNAAPINPLSLSPKKRMDHASAYFMMHNWEQFSLDEVVQAVDILRDSVDNTDKYLRMIIPHLPNADVIQICWLHQKLEELATPNVPTQTNFLESYGSPSMFFGSQNTSFTH
jgi:hypothetical protein